MSRLIKGEERRGHLLVAPVRLLVVSAMLVLLLIASAGCGGKEEVTTTTPENGGEEEVTTTTEDVGESQEGTAKEVVLMTHDSFAASEEVVASFEEQTGVELRILKSGDAGSMLNQAILTKDNPVADVVFGVDNSFLSRALKEGLFRPYESSLLSSVPDDLELDPEHRVTPIDYGDVCLNYDKEYFDTQGIAVPDSLRDLTKEEYRGLLVVEDPAGSSPGLAFLLATIAEFGEEGEYTWQDFWSDLRENDTLAVSGWEEAYYSEFSGGAGEGERPLVVSYASSPPAEVIFAEEELTEAPTGVITAGAFRQVEFAGILEGADHPDAAEKLMDFLLSVEFQEDIPLNMFVFPANEEAALPEEFTRYTVIPEDPLSVPADEIEEKRSRWLEEWTEIFL